jgi:hypothetical protein
MVRHDRGRTATRAAAGLVVAALVAGCGVPLPPEVPDTSAPSAGPVEAEVDRLVPTDLRSAELVAALDGLGTRIGQARDLLLAVAAGGDPDGVDRGGAVGVLLGVPGGGEAPGVLPAIEPDRGGTASDDLSTALLTLAGDVGGERGRLVIELARDPMLGDLGAWQRDPVGVIALLRAIAEGDPAGAGRLDATVLDAAVLELPGELTRALGYALVVASSDDPGLVVHAATQGAGRLGVVLIALELAVEQLGAPS